MAEASERIKKVDWYNLNHGEQGDNLIQVLPFYSHPLCTQW